MIVINAVVVGGSVHVEVVHWPRGFARRWEDRQVVRRGQFMLPPAQLTQRQALALVGEWLARDGTKQARHEWVQPGLF